MRAKLLLDEHYSDEIAANLFERGHDALAVVALRELRGENDSVIFSWAAKRKYRIVTENIKDFRPLLLQAISADAPTAALLLVPPRRFPRGRGDREAVITSALLRWLAQPDVALRPVEDWLI